MLARIICKHPFLHRELARILVIPDPLKPGAGGVKYVQPMYGADLSSKQGSYHGPAQTFLDSLRSIYSSTCNGH